MSRIPLLAAFLLLATLALSARDLVPIPQAENTLMASPAMPGVRGSDGSRSTFVQPTDLVFPHFATGAGWETDLVLVNLGASPVTFAQYFYDPSGKPLVVSFRSIPDDTLFTTSSYGVTLAAGESLNLRLFDRGGAVQTGWSALSYDVTSARIGGYAIFRQRISGTPDFEALVPLSAYSDFIFVMPFDNMNDFVTSMAILNPGSTLSTTVAVNIRDQSGKSLTTDTLTLSPGQQMSFALTERFPATRNIIGTIVFLGSTNRLSALGFRFNPGHAFATIPILNWSGIQP